MISPENIDDSDELLTDDSQLDESEVLETLNDVEGRGAKILVCN